MRSFGHFNARLSGLYVVIAVVLAVLTVGSRPAGAAGGGLAYDQILKSIMSFQPSGSGQSSGPPEPGTYLNGSFGADFQAAVDVGPTQNAGGGFFNVIKHAQQNLEQIQKTLKNGIPSKHYYLNGWEREEDPINQTATIYRGDQRQIIHLDLAKKTYYIESMGDNISEEKPPTTPSGQPQAQPPPQPGTAKMAITTTSAGLGPKTIDGQPTSGYKMTFNMAVTEATGSCKNGSFGTSVTEYISRFPEPTLALPSGKVIPRRSTPDVQRMSVTPGCKPTITANTKKGATPPAGMLALWSYMNVNGSMGAPPQSQNSQQPQGGGFGFLTERGNVHALGASDASLFQAPADFKQVSPPNSNQSSPNP